MPKRKFTSNTPDEIALLDGARAGDLDTVKRLLDQGLDPNTPDMRDTPWEVTPLMCASVGGHSEVVRTLLKAGAKVHLVNKNVPGERSGETALHYAAAGGHTNTAKLLLESKADIDKVSQFSGTPLTVAVEEQQLNMVQFLLDSGANANVVDKKLKQTPLHVAASLGFIESAKLLIKHGANINAKDGVGQTPFMEAAFSSPEIAFMLIDNSVDLKAAQEDGTTCLMWAVISKTPKLVSEVLKHRININALNDEGKSALDLAIRDKLPEIEALLREAGAKTGGELRPTKKSAVRKRR